MSSTQPPTRPLYIILGLILLLAFALRLFHASTDSFWTDEGLTPLRASYSVPHILSNEIIIQEVVTKDTHPPLFYLLIHGSRQLWGESDFAFRYPSLLAGLLLLPLLYQFGRRLADWRLGLLVALATAVNPLQIYYANEARMYTLLVLLTAVLTYLLWRALQMGTTAHGRGLPRLLALYGLFAALAFYTHYSTLFLLAGQSLFWAWLLWQNGYKRLLIGTAVAGLLAILPVTPFIIPRLFTGAEANYYYVSPWIMLQDVVRFFHLGRTVDFETTAVKLLNIGTFFLLLLGLYAAKQNRKRALLLVYLLAVVFGLMVGSLLKPMYQGVRHIMIGSPAFLLLGSWGIYYASQVARSGPPTRRWVSTAVALLGTLLLLGGSLFSVYNYYFSDQFGKDDFRSMIAFIEAHAGENDVIIYHNAILLPLHHHYQTRPDIPVTAVPLYPHLAQDVAVQQLESLAATYDRLWFVTDPPADDRDIDQITQNWLDTHLSPIGSFLFPAYTTDVRAIAYSSQPTTAVAPPPTANPLTIQWPAWPQLTAVALQSSQPVATPSLWFSLYWQGAAPPAEASLRFTLQDASGFTWWTVKELPILAKGRPWTADGVAQTYYLPLPMGILPGQYQLLAQPLSQLAGEPLADAENIATITVAPSQQWPTSPPNQPPALQFANGLQLARLDIVDDEVRPGHTLPLNLYWQTGPTLLADVVYELEVIAADGRLLRTQTDPVGASWLGPLPADSLLWEHTGLYFPPETEPGRYQLRWQLRQTEAVVSGRAFWPPWSQDRLVYGQVTVLPWPLQTSLPQVDDPIQAMFGSTIQLYSYQTAQTATAVEIELVWQALQPPSENYRLFVHLLDANEQIVAQIDPIPGGDLRPTKGWRTNEVLPDSHLLPLPADLAAGEYTLWLGLWQPDSGARLPITVADQPLADGRLQLGTVVIRP